MGSVPTFDSLGRSAQRATLISCSHRRDKPLWHLISKSDPGMKFVIAGRNQSEPDWRSTKALRFPDRRPPSCGSSALFYVLGSLTEFFVRV